MPTQPMTRAQFIAEHTIQPSAGPGMSPQNPYCVCNVPDGPTMARQGGVRT